VAAKIQTARGRPAWLLPAIAGLTVAGLAGWTVSNWGLEETDNAQLQAEITQISSRVAGTIEQVAAERDQAVAAGAPLVLLDARPARARLAQVHADWAVASRDAQAAFALAGATASNAAAAEGRAVADQLAAAAELARARADEQRASMLLRNGGISRQEADRTQATYAKAQGEYRRSEASRQSARASERQVAVDRQRAAAAAAKVQQVEAALAQARLDLAYTRIAAPTAGRIGDRSAEVGGQVQPGQPLMTLVGQRPWVEANFKETQLNSLYLGQGAEIRIDAFPSQVLHGHLLGIAPASGSRFALLPPENATGNFTKVVQRLTARISIEDAPEELRPRLVPGLSVNVRVRRR
jgi:membrane fusion protein (multidrug efflux system)